MALRVWRKSLRLAGLSRQDRYLAMTIGERNGAHFDALVQQSGSFADGFIGCVGDDRVGHAQQQPRAVGVARFQGPAQEQAAAARAAQADKRDSGRAGSVPPGVSRIGSASTSSSIRRTSGERTRASIPPVPATVATATGVGRLGRADGTLRGEVGAEQAPVRLPLVASTRRDRQPPCVRTAAC